MSMGMPPLVVTGDRLDPQLHSARAWWVPRMDADPWWRCESPCNYRLLEPRKGIVSGLLTSRRVPQREVVLERQLLDAPALKQHNHVSRSPNDDPTLLFGWVALR